MITQRGITIWHKGYDAGSRMNSWEPVYYPFCSLQEDVKVTVTDGGLKSANVIKIRIPTAEEIAIANGDKVITGKYLVSAPPDTAYSVIGFADNRKGSVNTWHWKVVCA